MRKSLIALAVLAVCWIAYVASPFLALYHMVHAIETRDAQALSRDINFVQLRNSLSGQIVEAYVRRAGIQLSPLAQSVVGSALAIADPIVDKLISPEAVATLMAAGWPTTVLPQVPSGTIGISSETLGTAWQIFVASRYGLGRAEIRVPASFPRPQRFGLQFRIGHWRWQLAGLVLPTAVLDALADELIRVTKTPVPRP
jgi:hypothetical protein